MYLKVDSFECMRGRVHLPLSGAWTANVTLDPASATGTPPVVGQRVFLAIGEGGFGLQGTVRRTNDAFGTIFTSIVGGLGGLPLPLAPKSFQAADVRTVLTDILARGGEQLSAAVDQNFLGTQLASWSVISGRTSDALWVLANNLGATWRALADGTIWMGVDTFPATALGEFELYAWRPQEYSAKIFAEDPRILPGETWRQGKVSDVIHDVDPEIIRTTVLFQDTVLVTGLAVT